MSTTTDSERKQAWRRYAERTTGQPATEYEEELEAFFAGYDAALASPTITALINALEQITLHLPMGGPVWQLAHDTLEEYRAALRAS